MLNYMVAMSTACSNINRPCLNSLNSIYYLGFDHEVGLTVFFVNGYKMLLSNKWNAIFYNSYHKTIIKLSD